MISFENGKGRRKKKPMKSLDGPGVSGGKKEGFKTLEPELFNGATRLPPFPQEERKAARLVDDADRDRSLLCRLLIVVVENESHSNGRGENAEGRKDFRTHKHDDI